ncbi:hypothetical protein SAMN04489729_6996 [Amycolatopsis lurida]|uniref:Uncharacterized protein n=1 Tax=Amycolatopsis lurida NRRL 2430 TaxID=1460371 RepID=A0A2P2FFB4_AMYLU|nr:DUF6573 family protein [Amycolatopsis lurida]KFU75410.1 hypothetical protein BB31_41630 [Amycolatopsis lurida NRRL 2430]SEE29880.1 hypothetical protein SAMN04489729_6996 [Amycolatopsis lurida]
MTDNNDQQQQDPAGFNGWEIIHAYTRADALRDGELVEADTDLLKQTGFRWPLAYTRSVFEGFINWDTTDEDRAHIHQTRRDRERSVLLALHAAIRAHTNPNDHTLSFTVRVTPRRGQGRSHHVTLYANFGPGDDAEPVITVLSGLTEL